MYSFFLFLSSTALLATLLTYWLNIKLDLGPVRASSLIALFTGAFFYFLPDLVETRYSQHLPLYIVGGSFIGMLSSTIRISRFSLIFSPLLFSFLLYFTAEAFNGFGGALGAMACIALMCTMAFPIITENKKVTYGYRLIRVMMIKRNRKRRV